MRLSVLLGVALSLVAASAQAADDNLLTLSSKLTVFRVFTGADGKSHVETRTLDSLPSPYSKRFIEANATRVTVGTVPDGNRMDFHVANNRTVLIALQGVLVIEVGDGKVYRLQPGQMALAEDRTGQGHISGCEALAGNRQCLTMQINLRNEDEGLQPANAPPTPR